MQNVRPCPYCGGEVEVVRIPDKVTVRWHKDPETGKSKKTETSEKQYRISCYSCHALVAQGLKFEIESDEDGRKRIEDYEKEQARQFAPLSSRVFRQTQAAQTRDYVASMSSRISPDDEEYEMHDASHNLFER